MCGVELFYAHRVFLVDASKYMSDIFITRLSFCSKKKSFFVEFSF
jgi:hypothetical protein